MGTGPWLDPPPDRFVPASFSARELVAFRSTYTHEDPPDVLPQANTGTQTFTDVVSITNGGNGTLTPDVSFTTAPSVVWGIAPVGDTGLLPDVWDPDATGFEVEDPETAVQVDLRVTANLTRSVPSAHVGWPGTVHLAPESVLLDVPPYVRGGQLDLGVVASWPTLVDLPADDTAAAVIDHLFDGIPGRLAAVPILDLTHVDPVFANTQWQVTNLALQVRVHALSRYRWVYAPSGAWRLRQRQTLPGTDSWPLRQRQNGGHTGSWPLRQRQRGV